MNRNDSMKMCSKIFEIFETYPAKHLLHVKDIDFNLSCKKCFRSCFKCVSVNITIPFD